MLFIGDFNAHLHGRHFVKDLDARGLELTNFLNINNLVSINTLDSCVGADSTFVTYDGRHESLIDHIVMARDIVDTISKCEVLDDSVLNVSRHRPIVCTLKQLDSTGEHIPRDDSVPRINWKKAQKEHIANYQSEISSSLQSVTSELNLPPQCTTDLDIIYDNFVTSMCKCSDDCIPKSKFRSFLKPYWNAELTDLHRNMKTMRRVWAACGRPRGSEHISYSEYKDAKRRFRRCHRLCAESLL